MDRDDLLHTMMSYEGDSMEFLVARKEHQEGRTFSAEALDDLATEMTLFAVSRVMRAWDATGEAPQSMTVHLSVDVT